MDQIQITTFADLQAFLEREGLALTCSRPSTVWRAALERLNDWGIVIVHYDGTGASMLEAVVDAIRWMYEMRKVRPLEFAKE